MARTSHTARALSVALLLSAAIVSGQDYPVKPVRIVTLGTGGSTDFTSRLLAQGLAGPLGQQVIVDNRATGVISAQAVSQAPPDGYTLLVNGSSFWVGPLFQKTPYDPVKDFAPISLTNRQPNILVVHPSLPVKSVKELIALAKGRPGELNYGAGSTGSSAHLAAELFKAMASVSIVRIPYKSGTAQMADLIGGHIQMTFGNAATVGAQTKAGKLRAIAVTSAEPSVLLPSLPTVAATGVPGYESVSANAVFAPARTPAAVINRLNQEIVRVVNMPEVKEKFLNTGSEPVGSSPEQLAAMVKSEVTRLGKVMKDAGIQVE